MTKKLSQVIINVKQALQITFGGVKHLKNRVEELRKKLNINQEELAKTLRVSRQTISSIENGRYNPSLELAFQIAEFFEKTIEEIFLYKEWKIWKIN